MIHDPEAKDCQGCENKLTQADPFLRGWFYQVKERWPTCHVAWAFRGEADQNADFNSGKSTKRWPSSRHNFTIGGKPHSLALDLFEIDVHGKASFKHSTFADIWTWCQEQGSKVSWGGNFVHLRDNDHFEISSPSEGS